MSSNVGYDIISANINLRQGGYVISGVCLCRSYSNLAYKHSLLHDNFTFGKKDYDYILEVIRL